MTKKSLAVLLTYASLASLVKTKTKYPHEDNAFVFLLQCLRLYLQTVHRL